MSEDVRKVKSVRTARAAPPGAKKADEKEEASLGFLLCGTSAGRALLDAVSPTLRFSRVDGAQSTRTGRTLDAASPYWVVSKGPEGDEEIVQLPPVQVAR